MGLFLTLKQLWIEKSENFILFFLNKREKQFNLRGWGKIIQITVIFSAVSDFVDRLRIQV